MERRITYTKSGIAVQPAREQVPSASLGPYAPELLSGNTSNFDLLSGDGYRGAMGDLGPLRPV